MRGLHVVDAAVVYDDVAVIGGVCADCAEEAGDVCCWLKPIRMRVRCVGTHVQFVLCSAEMRIMLCSAVCGMCCDYCVVDRVHVCYDVDVDICDCIMLRWLCIVSMIMLSVVTVL